MDNTRTETILDCVASYFVGLFFDYYYTEAVDYKNNAKMAEINTVLDGYKEVLRQYYKYCRRTTNYRDEIKGVVIHVKNSLNTLNFTPSKMILVKQFLPIDWDEPSSEEDRNNLLNRIIGNYIKKLICAVETDFIHYITDKKLRQDNVKAKLHRAFLKILVEIQNSVITDLKQLEIGGGHSLSKKKFAQEFIGIINKNNEYQHLIKKMQNIIIRLNAEKKQLLQRLNGDIDNTSDTDSTTSTYSVPDGQHDPILKHFENRSIDTDLLQIEKNTAPTNINLYN